MDEQQIQSLYEFFVGEGYDVNSLESFKAALSPNSPNRENLYNFFADEGYDVGSFDNFVFKDAVETADTGLMQDFQPGTQNRRPRQNKVEEKDTYIERTLGKNEVTDFFGDLYRAYNQGESQGATVGEAMDVFRAGADVDAATLQEYVEAVNKMEMQGPSEEMQSFSEIYEKEGKGVYGFLAGVINNPTVIPQIFTSSVRAMINPDSIKAGAVGAGTGALAGGGIGAAGGAIGGPFGSLIASTVGAGTGAISGAIAGMSGMLETGLAYTEFLKEELQKKDLAFNEKNIRTILEDQDALDRIQNRALGRGISIAAIDAFTGGLASNITRKVATKTTKTLAGLAGTAVEGVGGATGEAVARVVADQDLDVAEIGFEGVAGSTTAPFTVGLGLLKSPRYKLNKRNATLKQVQTLLNKGTPEEIAGAEIEIVNNPELKRIAQEKKQAVEQDALITRDLKQAIKNLSKEDLALLIPLEKRRQILNNNPTKAAKNELKIIDKRIDEITNKYTDKDAISKSSPEEIPLQKQPPTSTTVREGDPTRGEPTREGEAQEGQTTPGEEVQDEIEVSESEVTPNQQQFVDMLDKSTPKEIRTKEQALENLKRKQKALRNLEAQISDEAPNPSTFVLDLAAREVEDAKSTLRTFLKKPAVETTTIQDDAKATSPQPLQVGRNRVVIEEGVVKEILNPEGKPVSKSVRAKVEAKLIDDALIDVDKGTKAPPTSGLTELTTNKYVIDESTNPREIAELIDNIKSIGRSENVGIDQILKEDMESGVGALFGLKFSEFSLKKLLGEDVFNEKSPQWKRTWVDKTKRPTTRLQKKYQLDDPKSGLDIEDSDIVENAINEQDSSATYEELIALIERHPSRKSYMEAFKSRQEFTNANEPSIDLSEAEAKFEELTGLKATTANIRKVLATKEGAAQQRAETAIFEAERLQEEESRRKDVESRVEEKTPPEKPDVEERTKTPKEIAAEKRAQEEEKKDTKELEKLITKIKPKFFRLSMGRFIARIKKALGVDKRNIIEQQLRNTPSMFFDDILDNPNSTKFYRTLFRPLVNSFSTFQSNFYRLGKRVSSQIKKLSKDHNLNIKEGYMIRMFQLARENENNPGSETSPKLIDLLDTSINQARLQGRETVRKTLTELKNRFEKDGDINSQDIFDALSPAQKEVLSFLDKENIKLGEKIKVVFQRRGKAAPIINDYSHRVVLLDDQKQDVDLLNKKAESFLDPTLPATGIERTKGVKPISFDPFESLLKGAQETMIGYYMSPTADKVQRITKNLNNKFKKGSKQQNAAAKALYNVIREFLEATYIRTAIDVNAEFSIMEEFRNMGYRVLLSSVPRFGAELLGNSAMLIAQPAEVVKDAYTKYMPLSMTPGDKANEIYTNILQNLNSAETNKLAGLTKADTKYAAGDTVLTTPKKRKLKSSLSKKIGYITSMPKFAYKNIAKASDFLMGGADRAISRPMWLAKFANEFKKYVKEFNNEDVELSVDEFKKIADGSSKFLVDDKYKKAIEMSTLAADMMSAKLITSANPFNETIANVRRSTGGVKEGVKNYYRTINSFMARFTLNEYATARAAVGALLNKGEISKREAFLMLSGVLGRMSSYVVLYSLFSNWFDQLLDDFQEEDVPEEDVDYGSQLERQLLGSLMTLTFRQNLGNIAVLPINYSIEMLNSEYLEGLRNGDPYNSYDNSLVYSLIQLDAPVYKDKFDTLLPIIAGPYGPLLKSLFAVKRDLFKSVNLKTQKGRDNAFQRLEDNMIFDVMGNIGFIPLYKDFKRTRNKIKYSQDEQQPVKIWKKEDLKRFKNNPVMQEYIRNRLKQQKKSRK